MAGHDGRATVDRPGYYVEGKISLGRRKVLRQPSARAKTSQNHNWTRSADHVKKEEEGGSGQSDVSALAIGRMKNRESKKREERIYCCNKKNDGEKRVSKATKIPSRTGI